MKEKNKMILSYLNSSDTYTPSSDLAKYLNVSERSIKRYIKSINKELVLYGAKIDAVKGLGYKLIIESKDKFKEYTKNILDKKSDESISTTDLLRKILKEYPISLDTLSEQLYTSRSTLQNKLTSIRSLLSEFEISLKYKPYKGLYLDGEEANIRKCYLKYFFKDGTSNEIILSIDLDNISSENINNLKKYIENWILDKSINKNDCEINYIVKLVIVSCFRFNRGYTIEENILSQDIKIEYILEDNFTNWLDSNFNICLNKNEISYLNIMIQVDNKLTLNNKIKEYEIKELVNRALINIDMKYKVHLNEDYNLLSSLVKHIINSFHRYCLDIDIGNLILDQIKMSYPEAFNYALELTKEIESILNVKVNYNEVGYIAIHFATAIERAKQKTSYKSIIVCNTGLGTSELIRTKMRRYFPQIEVIGCYQFHYLEHVSIDEVDFIISTVNIEKEIIRNKDLIQVSHVLNDRDIQTIEDELNKIFLQGYLKSLFNIDTFYYKLEFKNKLDLINYICDDLTKNDYISEVDKNTILDREKLSSTEISDLVAVPHCISEQNKNVIAICTLKDAINWGSSSVKLVFIACLDSNIKENKHVFPFIHSRTKKGDIVNKLCECKSLNEFIEILMRSNNYDS